MLTSRAIDRSRLLALCHEVFHGDLALSGADSTSAAGAGAPLSVFEVEASVPGHAALERYLNRPVSAAGAGATSVHVRIGWRDDRLSSATGELLSGVHGELVARCPIPCTPESRASVLALGPDALIALVGCGAAVLKP
jgi:hypothetical protein